MPCAKVSYTMISITRAAGSSVSLNAAHSPNVRRVSTNNIWNPTGLCWGPASWAEDVWNHKRLPDYVNLNVGIIFPIGEIPVGPGFAGNLTVTRDGHVYLGGEGAFGTTGVSGMARGGWINQYAAPSACQIDDFVAGAGMPVSGFAPPPLGPSLGETWGHVRGTNANDFATQVGVGEASGELSA